MFGSISSTRCKKFRILMAKWAGDDSYLDPHFGDIRPGNVLQYLMHWSEVDNGCIKVKCFCCCRVVQKQMKLLITDTLSPFGRRECKMMGQLHSSQSRVFSESAWTKKQGYQNFIVVSPFLGMFCVEYQRVWLNSSFNFSFIIHHIPFLTVFMKICKDLDMMLIWES